MMTDLDEAMLAGWQEAQADEEKEKFPTAAEVKKAASYNAYDKRVSLHLAMLSATVAQNPQLLGALQKLPALDWDLYKLEQKDIEVIYAEFDSELEAKVKAEFEADPSFVIDLHHAEGTCPLCGHEGCRWLFKIQNTAGGQSVECGSECIIIHGLHVKGTETGEAARKALETAIRRAMRKLTIEKWHLDYNFKPEHLALLWTALSAIRNDFSPGIAGHTRTSAYYKLRDLKKLQKFYDRNGWLGTATRWAEWSRLAKFARMFNPVANANIPFPKDWAGVNPKPVAAPAPVVAPAVPVPAPAPVVAPEPSPEEAPPSVTVAPPPLPTEPEASEPVPAPAPAPEPAPKAADFTSLSKSLVFG